MMEEVELDPKMMFFRATRARLLVGFAKGSSNAPSIGIDLAHERRQKIRDSDGTDLTECPWTLQVRADVKHNDYVEKLGGIGAVSSFSRTGAFHIGAAIGPSTFDRLLAALEAGFLPQQICVHATGVEYGNGDGLVWIGEPQKAIVTEISFAVPVGASRGTPDDENDRSEQGVTVRDLETFRQAVRRDFASLMTPIYVIAVIVFFVGLKMFFR